MKFLLLLLLFASTDAKSLGHNVSSTLKTNSDGIQKMNRFARSLECDGLTTENPLDVIGQPCTSLTSNPEYTLKVQNVKGPKWDTFTSKLTRLSAVTLEIDGSDIQALNLDKLVGIEGSKDIIIKNNKELKEVSFTIKYGMDIGRLIIMDNEKLETVKISLAKAFLCAEVIIIKNPVLKTLEFTGAATYNGPKMEIRDNVQLKGFGDLRMFKPEADVVIEDNRLIEEAFLNQIKSLNAN